MRNIALHTINEVMINGQHSNKLINLNISKIENDADKRLYTNIVYGTITNYIYLEKSLEKILQTKLKTKVKNLILMSMYQIKFLDKIPDYAVINEAVELARKNFNETNAKTVNAILRKYADSVDEIKFDEEWINYSIPEWIYNLLKKQYPEQYRDMLENFMTKPKAIARINPNVDFPLDEFDIVKENYVIKNSGNIANTKAFENGKVTIQDLSSIETIIEANLKPGSTILDACAAPGTKSTLIAEQLSNDLKLYVNDINIKKKDKITENFARTKTNFEKLTFMPAQDLVNEYDKETFDVILLDVPCSGLGVFKRKPEIKYNIKPENLDELLVIQQEILNNCLSLLKADGLLIYSTCTLNKNENGKQLAKQNLEIISETTIIPDEIHDGFYHAYVKKGK